MTASWFEFYVNWKKVSTKCNENKNKKYDMYLIATLPWVFFQIFKIMITDFNLMQLNSRCCKWIWLSARVVMAHLKTDNFLVVKFSQNNICNVQQPWLIGETLAIFMAHFTLNSYTQRELLKSQFSNLVICRLTQAY